MSDAMFFSILDDENGVFLVHVIATPRLKNG